MPPVNNREAAAACMEAENGQAVRQLTVRQMSSKNTPGTLPTSAYTRPAPKAEILDIRNVRGAEDQQLQCDSDEVEVVVLLTVDFDTDCGDAEQDDSELDQEDLTFTVSTAPLEQVSRTGRRQHTPQHLDQHYLLWVIRNRNNCRSFPKMGTVRKTKIWHGHRILKNTEFCEKWTLAFMKKWTPKSVPPLPGPS